MNRPKQIRQPVKLTVSIERKVRDALAEKATSEGVTLSDVVRRALDRELQEPGPPPRSD